VGEGSEEGEESSEIVERSKDRIGGTRGEEEPSATGYVELPVSFRVALRIEVRFARP
jgi:hypothetical protein